MELHGAVEVPLGGGVGDAADGHLGGRFEGGAGPSAAADRRRPPEVLGEDLDVVDVGASGLDGIGDAEVEPGPAQRRDVVEEDLPHEGVGEAEGPRAPGGVDEEPLHHGRLDGVVGIRSRRVGDVGEQREVDVAPDHRGDGEELGGGVGQATHAAPDHVAHVAGHLGVDVALVFGQPGELDGVEGVALGPVVDGGQGRRGERPVAGST